MTARLERSTLKNRFHLADPKAADDLQWGDKDSAEALIRVLRPPESPRILFIGSYRADEAEESTFLQEWRDQKTTNEIPERGVTVSPLTVEQARELISSQLDVELEEREVQQLLEESGGNPFLLTELVSFVDPSTGQIEQIPLREVIKRKLDRLPSEAEQILNIVGVSGQALRLDEALKAVELDAQATSIVSHMRNEKLLRLTGADGELTVDTYHDKVRETVLRQMLVDDRHTIHVALAETIERTTDPHLKDVIESLESNAADDENVEQAAFPRAYDLAYHFDAGGKSAKAWRYALLALNPSEANCHRRYTRACWSQVVMIKPSPAEDLYLDSTYRPPRSHSLLLNVLKVC